VAPRDVGDVIMGCVLQAGAGMNVARQASLAAGIPVEVPAETINRVCGSGLQAVIHAAEAIAAGFIDTVVAGGTESMSNAPYLLKGARWGYRLGHGEAIDAMLAEGPHVRDQLVPCGITAEEVAARYGISRADQDAFALEPAARGRAVGDGSFAAEIVAVAFRRRRATRGRSRRTNTARGHDARQAVGAAFRFQKDGSVTLATRQASTTAPRRSLRVGRTRKAGGVPPLARIVSCATAEWTR
jgi:acetyl-CoA C-acetyltransferase